MQLLIIYLRLSQFILILPLTFNLKFGRVQNPTTEKKENFLGVNILRDYFSFMLKIFSSRRSHHDENPRYPQLESSSLEAEKTLVQQ